MPPKDRTQLAKSATAIAVKAAHKHGPLAPSEVLGATHFLLEAGIYASDALPERAEEEKLEAYLQRLDSDKRGHLESLSMSQGERLSTSLRAAILQILYLHYSEVRWIAPATAVGVNTVDDGAFRSYVKTLFQDPLTESGPSTTTVNRWTDMVEIVYLLYSPTVQKTVGITRKDLPSGTASCLLDRYTTWSRISYRMLPLIKEIMKKPRWTWAQLSQLEPRKIPQDKRTKLQKIKALRKIVFDSETKGGDEMQRELTGAGKSQGVEPFVIEPEIAARMTPRQKAALQAQSPWMKLPGDYTPDLIEHQVRLTWWPLCPICPEDEHPLSVFPDCYWCTHKDRQILSDEDKVPYTKLWHSRHKAENGPTDWEEIDDPGQHDDWKAVDIELHGLTGVMFTFWDDEPTIAEEVREVLEKRAETTAHEVNVGTSIGVPGDIGPFTENPHIEDGPLVDPDGDNIDYAANYVHKEYPQLIIQPSHRNTGRNGRENEVICIILEEDATYPPIGKYLDKHSLVHTTVGLTFSFPAEDLRRIA